MNIHARIALMKAYGTSEGVRRAWEVREHGAPKLEEHSLKLMNEVPRVDNLEFMMTSAKGNNMIRMDREGLKMVLRQALHQLEESGTGQEPKIDYINTPRGTETWHYANLRFNPKQNVEEGEKPVFDT